MTTHRLEITVLSGVSLGDVFRFDLEEGHSITIGRAQENDIVLQDAVVSRKHSKLEARPDGIYIVDLGSTHGTIHMGFRLLPGDENGRLMSDGDEFKIGEPIFRANYSAAAFSAVKAKRASEEAKVDTSDGAKRVKKPIPKKRKLIYAAAGVVALGLLGYAAMPRPKGGLPRQESDKVITMGTEKVFGYWPSKASGDSRDVAHLDKAQFDLPPSDLVVEYDFRSENPIEILIDSVPLKQIDPNPGFWQFREMIIRDPQVGKVRRLVFDNPDYPPPPGGQGRKLAPWGVRNVRATPISSPSPQNVDDLLNSLAVLCDRIDRVPDGLYTVIRAMQRLVIEQLKETSQDAVSFDIDIEAPFPRVDDMITKFQQMRDERKAGITAQQQGFHLNSVIVTLSQLEGELWRRLNGRLKQAEFMGQSKDYIEAHDSLQEMKRMFSDESDYRWILANRMLNDNKIVPKRVRDNPAKYRRH